MPDREKVKRGMKQHRDGRFHSCDNCPYVNDTNCQRKLYSDALELLEEQDEEHNRLLSWLGKFCRHIDNGDKWLTDEENLAFFKEKMKQQFDWDTD